MRGLVDECRTWLNSLMHAGQGVLVVRASIFFIYCILSIFLMATLFPYKLFEYHLKGCALHPHKTPRTFKVLRDAVHQVAARYPGSLLHPSAHTPTPRQLKFSVSMLSFENMETLCTLEKDSGSRVKTYVSAWEPDNLLFPDPRIARGISSRNTKNPHQRSLVTRRFHHSSLRIEIFEHPQNFDRDLVERWTAWWEV